MRVALRLFLVALTAVPAADAAGRHPLPLNASPYPLCADADPCPRIGKVRILGALVVPSRTVDGKRLASLSALAWDDDDGVLYAVSDKGQLFGLKPEFRAGQLADVRLVSGAHLIDPATKKPVRYRRSDAEGLDVLNGRNGKRGDTELVVSFEGRPRVARHRPDGSVVGEIALSAPLNDLQRFRYNRMFEGVCVHPREGILVVPEEPLTADRNTPRLYRTDARSWTLPASRGSIVDMACLPDGDVLLMERDFSPITLRIVVTLRRLHLREPVPFDRLLEHETVAVFDNHDGLNLDNFEGLTRHRGNRFFMVSDDNDTLLQRTLLVYFELLDEAATGK
jgi:hypothetical protein